MSGYQVYIVGELHGITQNGDFELRYLSLLHQQSGLRDVALEEKSVYEDQAEAYVAGRADSLPSSLCLRAPIFDGIRSLNQSLAPSERIRAHLVDLDSPATAIRAHLLAIKARIPQATPIVIPDTPDIQQNGIAAVARLQSLARDARTRAELRTLRHSILSLQLGFEVDTGPGKGSPYLEDREQAVASNIEDLLHSQDIPSILVLYGFDHSSQSMRHDGGPNRDQDFAPMALRLRQTGIRLYSVVSFPLSGSAFWRGRPNDLLWTASDGHLASGETLNKLLASAPTAKYFFIDPRIERAQLPSQDVSNFVVNAFVLFPSATPIPNLCVAR